MSFWIVPRSCCQVEPAILGGGQVERHDDDRRRIDGHRHRDLFEVDAVEQDEHVVERVHGHAQPADLAAARGIVAIEAHQRGQVERRRQPGLPFFQQELEPLVGLARRAEAGELAHRPEPPAVHGRVHAAGERILAGIAEVGLVVESSIVGCTAARSAGRSRSWAAARGPATGPALRPRVLWPRDRPSGSGSWANPSRLIEIRAIRFCRFTLSNSCVQSLRDGIGCHGGKS